MITVLGYRINISEFNEKVYKRCKLKLTVVTSKSGETTSVWFKNDKGHNVAGFSYANFPNCCAYGIASNMYASSETFKGTDNRKILEYLEELICSITRILENTAILYVISGDQKDLRKLFIKKEWKRIGQNFENNNSGSDILTYRKIIDWDDYDDDYDDDDDDYDD